jgi:hypothetical protein
MQDVIRPLFTEGLNNMEVTKDTMETKLKATLKLARYRRFMKSGKGLFKK